MFKKNIHNVFYSETKHSDFFFFFSFREKGDGQKIGIIDKIEMLFSENNAACKWEIDYAM